MTLQVFCPAPADTMAIGRRLASLLRVGDVVLVAGELGAGKTTFVSGVAEGLGVEDPVTSPSFVLSRTYDGLLPLTHADIYRLTSLGEVADLDLIEEAMDGVLIIEWGNAIEQVMPDSHLLIRIEVDDAEGRELTFVPHGEWVGRPLREIEL